MNRVPLSSNANVNKTCIVTVTMGTWQIKANNTPPVVILSEAKDLLITRSPDN